MASGELGRGRGSASASTSAAASRVPSLSRGEPSAPVETDEVVATNDSEPVTGTAYGVGSTTLGVKCRKGQNGDEEEGDRDVVGDMLDEDDALQASAEAGRSGELPQGKKASVDEVSEGIPVRTGLGEGSSSLRADVGMGSSGDISFDVSQLFIHLSIRLLSFRTTVEGKFTVTDNIKFSHNSRTFLGISTFTLAGRSVHHLPIPIHPSHT